MKQSRWVIAVSLLIVLIAGCGGPKQAVKTGPDTPTAVITAGDIETRLRAEASRWRGTPHRMGGGDRNGIDCSGLVQRIFQDLFDIRMPRTARQQAASGVGVGRPALEPGDLIFFKPPGKKDHVGIYLGRGEFVHTSASRGVMISRMDSSYWRKYYWKARRILP